MLRPDRLSFLAAALAYGLPRGGAPGAPATVHLATPVDREIVERNESRGRLEAVERIEVRAHAPGRELLRALRERGAQLTGNPERG